MAGLVSSAGPMVIPKSLPHVRGRVAAFLGLLVLVTALTTVSPVAASVPWLDPTTTAEEVQRDAPRWTESSPSALPVSHSQASGEPDSTPAIQSLPSPGALPSNPTLNRDTRTVDTVLSQWGLSPSENSKSLASNDPFAESSQPPPSPPLSPPEPVMVPKEQFAGPVGLSRDLARTNLTQNPLVVSEQHSQSTESIQFSTLTRPTLPQFVTLKSDQRAPDQPPLVPTNQEEGASEQTPAITTSLSVPPLRAPKPPVDVPGFDLDVSDNLGHFSLNPRSNTLDVNQLSPSGDPMQQDVPAQGLHMLLAPSYVPFVRPHPTSAPSEPTLVPPEDFFPTNTMDVDWGSGDYMETMSFLGSDLDDYSLVTNVPSDMYDLEDSNTESYDTSFPSRVGVSPSSIHHRHISPSLTTAYSSASVVPTSIHPSSSSSSSAHPTLEPTTTPYSGAGEVSDVDWSDAFTIEPTDLLLPDMNSMEYYTTQLTRENSGEEHRGNVTTSRHVSLGSISTTHIMATSTFAVDPSHMLTAGFGGDKPQRVDNTTWVEEGSSSTDQSGFEPVNDTTPAHGTEATPHLVNVSEPFVEPSLLAPTPSMDLSSSIWAVRTSTRFRTSPTTAPTVGPDSASLTASILPSATTPQPDDVISSSSLTDVHWFTTESVLLSTSPVTPVLTTVMAFTSISTEPPLKGTAVTKEANPNVTSVSTEAISNVTFLPPFMVGDQGATDHPDTTVVTRANTNSALTITTITTTTKPVTTLTTTSTTFKSPPTTPPPRQYLCNIDKPAYLVRVGFPSGATVGYAKSQVRDILKSEFNKSVELQVVDPPPKFVFRVVSGPVVYTAVSVINALRRSGRRFLSVSPNWTVPDHKYQIHSVLQFVPSHIDVRACNFSERIERGLTMAFAEVRRRSQGSTNFTVHIVNITMAVPRGPQQRLPREPVDVTFAVRGPWGYLMGSEVSDLLINQLNMVEFSYYMGFPVLQIAEPFHYPELNTTQLLRSSWVRTVLLGVLDQRVGERTFQAKMERRLALLLGEALGPTRRVKRATSVGNDSVQIVSTSRLVGVDHPLEMVYFVEGPSGQRQPGVTIADRLNGLDVQRAAIVLGYRVQGILAQPLEKVVWPPSDDENNNNLWIAIGVLAPLLALALTISFVYWKMCRTDKLEFQPDAMTSIQQRQKLQAPSVKGFDFAKLHLGQHSKDDIMVIQEPGPGGLGPLPAPTKDGVMLSVNGEVPTPKAKASVSSTKASRSGRRRGRISPSDGDSVASDRSSGQESTEENLRANDSKQARKIPINVLNGKNRIGPPPMNGHGAEEQLSSASIFEHVDRMSRATDAARRLPNKIQLIAMQPMPVPPLHSPTINGKMPDNNQINKEIQVALRHKSEIEHHRNKIRLRAKRKGHYDFPAMDDLTNGFGDAKDQDRIYQKAQIQIDKILDPDVHMPAIFMESKKSGRGKRSPKQRKKDQLSGSLTDADKDHLITNDCDATYRRYPGVSNIAYVSDLDQGPGSPPRSPSPNDDVFLAPASSPPGHAPPPPPYMPPQPSIEEARQQMHSLLDDAFALVSPTSQGSTAGITLPGVGSTNPSGSSPPARGPPRPWGSSYPALSPFSGRYGELALSPPSVQSMLQRQGLSPGYPSPGEVALSGEQLHPDSLYASRSLYTEELPSSARPRPVGGTAGAQLHHLTQVGLSSRINGYPAGGRGVPGQNGGVGWNPYEDSFSRAPDTRDALFLGYPDYSSSIFQMPRSGIREPSAPPAHLDAPGLGYPSVHEPLDTSPPSHSSASLIKAIREELLRLSQKQSAVPSYHS